MYAVAALAHYALAYDDEAVKESFEIRNLSMHEYLNPKLLFHATLPQCFTFLHRCVDHAISQELGLTAVALKNAGFMFIENRVL